jgi:hypothetical protein
VHILHILRMMAKPIKPSITTLTLLFLLDIELIQNEVCSFGSGRQAYSVSIFRKAGHCVRPKRTKPARNSGRFNSGRSSLPAWKDEWANPDTYRSPDLFNNIERLVSSFKELGI